MKQKEDTKTIDMFDNSCISCTEPFSKQNVFTEAGWREVQISRMCERCFDELFDDED